MRPPLFVLLGAAIGVSACTSIDSTTLRPGVRRSPVNSEKVVIYRTAEEVPGKYEALALIEVNQPSGYSDATLYENMRKKAATLGADGIILGEIEQPGAVLRALMPLSTRRRGRATAIVLKAPQP